MNSKILFTMIKYKVQCESLHSLKLYAQINLQCTTVYAVRTALMYPTYEECVQSAKEDYDLPSSVLALSRNDFADDNLIRSEIYESRFAMEVDLLMINTDCI